VKFIVDALLRLFEMNISAIESALGSSDFVELGHDNLIVHD